MTSGPRSVMLRGHTVHLDTTAAMPRLPSPPSLETRKVRALERIADALERMLASQPPESAPYVNQPPSRTPR